LLRLIDYHLGNGRVAWFACGGIFDALLCPAHHMRLKWLPPMDWVGPNYSSAIGTGKAGVVFFLAAGLRDCTTNPQTVLGFVLPLAIVACRLCFVLAKSNLEQRLDRTTAL